MAKWENFGISNVGITDMQYIKYGFLTLMMTSKSVRFGWKTKLNNLNWEKYLFLSCHPFKKGNTAVGSPIEWPFPLVSLMQFYLGVTPESYTRFLNQSNIE